MDVPAFGWPKVGEIQRNYGGGRSPHPSKSRNESDDHCSTVLLDRTVVKKKTNVRFIVINA
jgi:hypothetical protein